MSAKKWHGILEGPFALSGEIKKKTPHSRTRSRGRRKQEEEAAEVGGGGGDHQQSVSLSDVVCRLHESRPSVSPPFY